MALSTGFDETKVKAALSGRIGWRNPTLQPYDIVDTGNRASASGRFFNDSSFHASCTIQNIKDTQEDADISDADFNTLLSDLKNSIIVSCVNSVFDKTELIESGLLFQRPNWPANYTPTTIANTGKFCGVRIGIGTGEFAVVIDSLTILLDSDKTFNVYIYKDFKTAALATIEVAATAYEETSVVVGRALNYLSADNKGGAYWIGYYQNDLGTAKALDCDPRTNIFKVFNAVSIESVMVDGVGFNRFDYSSGYNTYGLNLELSSYYDYTDRIVKAAHQFDEYIGLSMAAKVIEQITNTQRSNGVERQGNINVQRLHEDLNAPDYTQGLPISPGLKSKLKNEVVRLKKVFHQSEKPMSVSISTCK